MSDVPFRSNSVMLPVERRSDPAFPPDRMRRRAQAAEPVPEEPSLLIEYGRMVAAHRYLVVCMAVAGGIFGILTTLPRTPIYEARTSLDIQGLNENFMNMRAVDPTGQSGNYSPESYLQTQIRLLQSATTLERAKQKLMETSGEGVYEPRDVVSRLRRRAGIAAPAPISHRELIDKTASTVTVKPLGMTRLVEASCQSPDARVAADYCNTLAREFIQQDMEVRWESAEKTGEWLTRQLADVRNKLERSEQKLQSYAQESKMLFSTDKESVAQERLRQYQAELSRAQADRMTKQAQYELTRSASIDSLPPVLDSGPLKEYQMRLSELRRQQAELGSMFTEDYSKVKRLNAQITELQNTLTRERGNVIDRIRNEFAAAQQRENLLTTAYNAQEKLVSSMAPKTTQYNMLQREVESGRQLYETLLQRVKEAGFASAMKSSPIRVVDPAKVPQIPISPRRSTSAAAGLAVGTLLGVLGAFLKERTDRKLRAPGDARMLLHVRELGAIPSARIDHDARALTVVPKEPEDGKDGKSVLALAPASDGGRRANLALISWHRRQSLLAESYRSVMNSLVFATGGSLPARAVVITSPSVGDGKTTLVTNLGIALAQTRRRVILLDGDLRRPRLHNILNVPNTFGLRNILRGEVDVESCPVSKLGQPTFVPGLSLMPAGAAEEGEDPASLLHSEHLVTLIRRLREQFDIVMIDTSPMQHMSDARVLGRLTDGVVLVFRAGSTTLDTALSVQGVLEADSTPVLGVILNDFHPGRSARNRYYGGYYEYSQKASS